MNDSHDEGAASIRATSLSGDDVERLATDDVAEGVSADRTDAIDTPLPPTLREATGVWMRVAASSFGGPAGQIAVMHRIIVDERRWLDERRFVHALNYCMLLPGPEAQQLATYIGWLLHGVRGGLIAGILFILPGFVAMLVASILYVRYPDVTLVQGILFGLKPAVLAIVLQAAGRLGGRLLARRESVVMAIASFVAMFVFSVPFPIILLIGAIFGTVRLRPVSAEEDAAESEGSHRFTAIDGTRNSGARIATRLTLTLAIGLTLWFAPLGLLAIVFGPDSVFVSQGLFFSRTALITFGGAYSVLTYVGQQSVERFGWLRPGEMLDGLSLGETTPGPLVMVVQFVAFVGAWRMSGELDPILSGTIGATVAVWVTFVPCFLFVFLGARFVERLRRLRSLSGALAGISASVLGVMANLIAWFALHTWFGTVEREGMTGLGILVPDPTTLRPAAVLITLLAVVLTFVARRGLAVTLLSGAGAGIVCRALGWV